MKIYHRRNNKGLTEIIEMKLYDLQSNSDKNRSELMNKALNYLKNFWNQIFTYRNDGDTR